MVTFMLHKENMRNDLAFDTSMTAGWRVKGNV